VKKKPQHSPHSKEQLLRERKRGKSRNPSPDLKKNQTSFTLQLKRRTHPTASKVPSKGEVAKVDRAQ
jgi:hypothetical protein